MAEVDVWATWERFEGPNGPRIATVLTRMETPPIFVRRHWRQEDA